MTPDRTEKTLYTTSCPYCGLPVTHVVGETFPLHLNPDNEAHSGTCEKRVRFARIIPERDKGHTGGYGGPPCMCERCVGGRDPVQKLIPAAALPRAPITIKAKR